MGLGPDALDRILVVRLGSLGDLVHTLPAVSALRRKFPEARIDADAPVEAHDKVEQLYVAGIDHPVDAGRRILLPKRRHDGNRVHDVAKRAEANNQKAVHLARPMRASNSRVE